ncbi:Hypothetical predicted protein [Paramuricea clavata]|uniref:Uncharacterized protein n=1 Tax=Paramuricea clavata TaxID=317549 RepID=A0A7D9HNB7_PARCT|nr:Hypothetical predicted protein [Paramuricea clavata]
MAEMSVVSLNVNALRDHRKRRLLFDFLKYEKFDVIFLQETHIATVEDCVKWNKVSGLKGYWSLGLSNSCGIYKASSNVGPSVWKLNVSLLQEVCEQIASCWEHWKDRKSDFGNVAEWWDSGKLRVKSLLLKYSHKEFRKRKQERATILNHYRRIVCKTIGG